MPIYAYKCESCGHAKDVLQKMSDAPLTDCPQCGAAAFKKQVTAAGFQLKGSGWYVTDFRGGNTAAVPPATAADGASSASAAEGGGVASASAASEVAAPASSTAAASSPAPAAAPATSAPSAAAVKGA